MAGAALSGFVTAITPLFTSAGAGAAAGVATSLALNEHDHQYVLELQEEKKQKAHERKELHDKQIEGKKRRNREIFKSD